ncbi:hypothetical protein [Actinomadura gamaensis]|uniref:DUF397 domain-containing protein n=1 Tax=Actinomadura gamaensis TaxID=1763541 RepID=A0ABV9TQ61_9ACTN
MALRFLCIDPDTNGGHCPALHVDDETGDLLVTGRREDDVTNLRQVEANSGIGDHEVLVRLPARMKAIVLAKLLEEARDADTARTAVRRTDRGD